MHLQTPLCCSSEALLQLSNALSSLPPFLATSIRWAREGGGGLSLLMLSGYKAHASCLRIRFCECCLSVPAMCGMTVHGPGQTPSCHLHSEICNQYLVNWLKLPSSQSTTVDLNLDCEGCSSMGQSLPTALVSYHSVCVMLPIALSFTADAHDYSSNSFMHTL